MIGPFRFKHGSRAPSQAELGRRTCHRRAISFSNALLSAWKAKVCVELTYRKFSIIIRSLPY
jgi:hypothetical protein